MRRELTRPELRRRDAHAPARARPRALLASLARSSFPVSSYMKRSDAPGREREP